MSGPLGDLHLDSGAQEVGVRRAEAEISQQGWQAVLEGPVVREALAQTGIEILLRLSLIHI